MEKETVYEKGWPGPEGELWIVVNRFVSDKLQGGKQGGITMTFMHANGFHKEVRSRLVIESIDGDFVDVGRSATRYCSFAPWIQ
jgi:hypothetical protein